MEAGGNVQQRTLFWQTAVLSVCFMGLVVTVTAVDPGDTQIRKPTGFNDSENVTTSPENATVFPHTYNQNLSAETLEPVEDPSIIWKDWDTEGAKPYDALSVSVTANASNWLTTNWGMYFINSSDAVECNSNGYAIKDNGGDANFDTKTNFTRVLPYNQDLSLLEVCILSTGSDLTNGQIIETWDIRTNGTVETTSPLWRHQQQNVSSIIQGEPVELAAQGQDNRNLSHAVLATNETGTWENKSIHGSPIRLYAGDTWTWSNFTWDNTSVTAGSTLGWRIWYNDTAGNVNATDTEIFSLEPPVLAVNLTAPPTPFTVGQNETFTLNASITCRYGDCGAIDGTAQYNASGPEPNTSIPADGEPFHTTGNANPQTCDTDLQRDDACYVDWHVNATGTIGSRWLVDVNASSSLDTVAWNDTADADVEIIEKVIDITLGWDAIRFGSVFVGTANNTAKGNSNREYNVTVTDRTTVDVDIWMNASDLTGVTEDDTISAGNITWNATTNDAAVTEPLSQAWQPIRRNVSRDTRFSLYYWLNMPYGIYADDYIGTLWVKANETA